MANPYHKRIPTYKPFRKWKLVEILFPESQFYIDNDLFFKHVWRKIDQAKVFIFLIIFHIISLDLRLGADLHDGRFIHSQSDHDKTD